MGGKRVFEALLDEKRGCAFGRKETRDFFFGDSEGRTPVSVGGRGRKVLRGKRGAAEFIIADSARGWTRVLLEERACIFFKSLVSGP